MNSTSLQKLVLAIISFALWIVPQSADSQQLTQYLSSDSLSVGDVVEFSITINYETSYDEIIYPDSSDFGEQFEIRSRERHDVSEYKDSLVYELQFFGTADTTLSSMPVFLRAGANTDTLFTEAESVFFKTVLQSEEEDFRPFKPIFDFAATWWPYLLALVLLAIIAWYLYKKYFVRTEEEKKPKTKFTPTPFKDPLSQLSKEINRLHNITFDSEEDFEKFYIDLGDSIRTYFEELYDIPALESTSGEIIRDLNRKAVDRELVDHTRRVLNEADMVKFARFKPTVKQAEKALEKADSFLKKVRNIDGPRIEQLRRQHYMKVEQARNEFERQQEEEQNL